MRQFSNNTRVFFDVTWFYSMIIEIGPNRIMANLNTSIKIGGPTRIKFKILSSTNVVTALLMTLAMIKLASQLEFIFTEQSKEEVNMIFKLNYSMNTISTTF